MEVPPQPSDQSQYSVTRSDECVTTAVTYVPGQSGIAVLLCRLGGLLVEVADRMRMYLV